MTILRAVVVVAGVSLVVLSCESTGTVAHNDSTRYFGSEGTNAATRVDTPSTEARLNNVAFLTDELNRRIAVQSTGASRTATNTLSVYAVLRNRTDYQQRIQIRTQYFGPGRDPNEGPDAWQSMFLAPNSIQTYRTTSRGTNAEYYYIEVIEMP